MSRIDPFALTQTGKRGDGVGFRESGFATGYCKAFRKKTDVHLIVKYRLIFFLQP